MATHRELRQDVDRLMTPSISVGEIADYSAASARSRQRLGSVQGYSSTSNGIALGTVAFELEAVTPIAEKSCGWSCRPLSSAVASWRSPSTGVFALSARSAGSPVSSPFNSGGCASPNGAAAVTGRKIRGFGAGLETGSTPAECVCQTGRVRVFPVWRFVQAQRRRSCEEIRRFSITSMWC
jgi:hypothetical protein